jgi:F-box and WD-40 domain protein 1/11
MNPGPWALNPSFNKGEDSQISLCQQDHESSDVFEEISVFPEPTPRHRTAKSFSSIRHGVDGLRALGRRLSVTIRGKAPKHNSHVPQGSERYVDEEKPSGAVPEGRHRNAWFKGHSINRRPSLHSVSALHSFYAPTANVANFIPGMGFEPPVFSNDLTGGAAARAAAAAQNELAKTGRSISSGDSKIFDSESGIGFDLRDRSDLSDSETAVVRLGELNVFGSCVSAKVLN